ncbi:MAG: flagellar export chaperone FliS [Myxococcaceae bacterium]|nr:flagellar export chaperone FliS [Myxococcaceae bacterium]
MIAASRYSQTQRETASKERLMVLLFERALRDIREGTAAIEARRSLDAAQALTHASDIVTELHATLDRNQSPELCDYLSDVYRFVMLRLTQASLKLDATLAREAERAFVPVVEAFQTAVSQAAAGAPR